ncbi:MAG: glycosyltransferase family 4 protein [Kofleriaceae bacterium]|nr:MAG: glycosyltransferase family 4 protein [Kofleriaceae bacterium]
MVAVESVVNPLYSPLHVRVLFFGDTPHRLAGAQRSLMAALTRIGRHGIEPLVIFPGPGVVEEAYRAAGIPTRLVAAPPSLLLFNRQIQAKTPRERAELVLRELVPYTGRLARLIRDEAFEAVHCNTSRGMLIAGPAAKLARRATVLHLRGAPEGFGRGMWLAAQLLATRIVLVAHALEDGIDRPFRRRAVVVHNGVVEQPERDRIAARRALADRMGRPILADSDETLFVAVSSLTPFKGLHHLLDAAVMVRERGVRARYVLAGGGGDERYEAWLRRRITTLELDDIVDAIGFVPDPLRIMAAADAVVVPSVHRERFDLDGELLDVHGTEGLPRSILESLSLGVPPIATRVQGVVEQIEDGETGLIVPPSDPRALADALVRAATDPAWREAAATRGRETARSRFTVDHSAAGLAAALRDAVGDAR